VKPKKPKKPMIMKQGHWPENPPRPKAHGGRVESVNVGVAIEGWNQLQLLKMNAQEMQEDGLLVMRSNKNHEIHSVKVHGAINPGQTRGAESTVLNLSTKK
jgi:hypothetical protein